MIPRTFYIYWSNSSAADRKNLNQISNWCDHPLSLNLLITHSFSIYLVGTLFQASWRTWHSSSVHFGRSHLYLFLYVIPKWFHDVETRVLWRMEAVLSIPGLLVLVAIASFLWLMKFGVMLYEELGAKNDCMCEPKHLKCLKLSYLTVYAQKNTTRHSAINSILTKSKSEMIYDHNHCASKSSQFYLWDCKYCIPVRINTLKANQSLSHSIEILILWFFCV